MVKQETIDEEMRRTKISIKERVFGIFGDNYRNRIINKLQYKLKIIDYLIFFFAWTGGLLAVISCDFNMKFVYSPNDYQLNHLGVFIQDDERIKMYVNVLRAINSGFTLLTMILLFVHYRLVLQIKKMKMILSTEQGLISSGLWKGLALEIFLNAWHMIPFKDGWVLLTTRNPGSPDTPVMIETVITIMLLFFRSYHIVKLIAVNSRFNRYDCEMICLEHNTVGDNLFALKAEFKMHPFLILSLVMFTSIFVFGYSVRLVEVFYMFGQAANQVQDWRFIWNGFWCVIITMSTVGYGDLYPVSILGRSIIILACIWGTFLISLTVAALTVGIDFDPQERVAFETIQSVNFEVEHGVIGTVLIQTIFRYKRLIERGKANYNLLKSSSFIRQKSIIFNKMKETLEQFRAFKMRKSEQTKYLYIQLALKKIANNLNVGMDRIKEHVEIVGEVNKQLETYEKNQTLLKQRCLELYKEMEQVSLLKEKYLKKL